MNNSTFKYFFCFILALSSYESRAQQEKLQLAKAYYEQGEYDKSLELYKDLAKTTRLYPTISDHYIELLDRRNDLDTKEKFLLRAIKSYPDRLEYGAKLAESYAAAQKLQKLEKLLDSYKKNLRQNPYGMSVLAYYLNDEGLHKSAIRFYKLARIKQGISSLYALEMAAIYQRLGDKPAMLQEYITYATESTSRLSRIKNLLQNYLSSPEDYDDLEQSLINKMQEDQDNIVYPELMVWLELQRKNFYGAFVQTKAIDLRLDKPGDRSMQIGKIAWDNEAYIDAEEIYRYVSLAYPNSHNAIRAKTRYLNAREQRLKNEYPVDTLEIRILANQYFVAAQELKPAQSAFEMLRSKALLDAYYLSARKKALSQLEQLIGNPRVSKKLKARCKLDLGDLYLIDNQPWEATLLYSQVEKAYKDHPLSSAAKLKNARLHYFIGDFELAKGHLDILKRNTSKDISNDALALGMTILDNYALDTADQVLREFAQIELLLFQHENDAAYQKLIHLTQNHKTHPLIDEAYWLLAKMLVRAADYNQAITYLDKIQEQYAYDILADDAAFKKAKIVELDLKQKDEAQLLYQSFLLDYPGSMYAAEARKRFRKLRGDYDSL